MSKEPEEMPEMVGKTEKEVEKENKEDVKEPEVVEQKAAEAEKGEEPRYFKTKVIRFGPIDYRIVTQNLNGPCPLIAIINTLVLKGKVTIPAVYVVTSTELLNLLSNVILSAEPSNQKTKEIYEANLRDVMNLMPTLVNGLDVNVKFSAVNQFEFTPALSLFDLVHINLYHVWLPDPQFPVIFDLIKSLNYNELVEKICAESDTTEREMYKSWYEDTQSQITFIGVQSLFTEMKDAELAVLFQNNHFSTILRRRDEIFKLVSDEGIADETSIVWETFNSVDGDSIFVNCDFGNFKPRPLPTSTSSGTTVTHSSIEHQIDEIEEGIEMIERPASAPIEAPPTSPAQTTPSFGASGASGGAQTARGASSGIAQRTNAGTPTRRTQKDEGKGCQLM
ncbi:hypothetical protein GCK72_015714 [Caenorhabditis remanei]|uniref:Ubiquitin carboxyl-terminal hydrolase n=1 Tax=Caenorhabditis remanei TaxID=31234 RepID=A0A6A5GX87_CAERE|nr:hypothetical protein GCK72_015714 [Caenorhabditis remanei]KAF1759251.1 hypothetical protein GCK72_015714 [Caenorhabditis remanei]